MKMNSSIWIVIVSLSVVFCSGSIDDNIFGTTAPGWEFVRELFLENFVQQEELGAAITVYYQGYPVVNLRGGWFDEVQTKPYDNETLQLVFSTTKGIVAMAAAICVQRGLFDYSEFVTKYWPEYQQNGKENTTIADILSHRAGIPYTSVPISQYTNWTAMIHTLEEEKPLWIPGTDHGYHSVTYGWLVGEIIRRVDPMKRSFGKFIQDELVNPFDIEFYIGLPSNIQYRLSPVNPHLSVKNLLNETMLNFFEIWNDPNIHQAEIPAAIGISNAWSIARIYAAFIGNIKDKLGQRLVNDEVLKRAIQSNTPSNEIDRILQYYSSFSMGFHRFNRVLPDFGPNVFGHHGRVNTNDQNDMILMNFLGAGGSIAFASVDKNLTFAYVMNRIKTDPSTIIDSRIQLILDQIATKINNHHFD